MRRSKDGGASTLSKWSRDQLIGEVSVMHVNLTVHTYLKKLFYCHLFLKFTAFMLLIC